ncbi:hypothetical protein FACS1894166_13500 [Bacilli bacterium]|nr:hypothetical protein FACS1894166_13500 [Bacilli bacterium]
MYYNYTSNEGSSLAFALTYDNFKFTDASGELVTPIQFVYFPDITQILQATPAAPNRVISVDDPSLAVFNSMYGDLCSNDLDENSLLSSQELIGTYTNEYFGIACISLNVSNDAMIDLINHHYLALRILSNDPATHMLSFQIQYEGKLELKYLILGVVDESGNPIYNPIKDSDGNLKM